MAETTVNSVHCMKVCRSLWSLQQSGQLCDIQLEVGENVIVAHRSVLAATSPFFQFFLDENTEEPTASDSNSPLKVSLPDAKLELVQEVIRCAYTGLLALTEENVDEIQNLCEKWNIDSGKVICEKFRARPDDKSQLDVNASETERSTRKRSLDSKPIEVQNDDSDADTLVGDDYAELDVQIKQEAVGENEEWEPAAKKTKSVEPLPKPAPKLPKRRGRPPKAKTKVKVLPKIKVKKRGPGRPRKIKIEETDEEEEEPRIVKVTRKTIKRKRKTKKKGRQFKKCHKCHEEFDTPEELAEHRIACRLTNPVRPYTIRKCRKCKQVFDSPEDCRIHRENCEAESYFEDETNQYQRNTESSENTRTSQKRVYRRCHRCHVAFDTPEQLTEHKETCRVTKSLKPYEIRKCRKCKAEFNTTEECSAHMLECNVPQPPPSPERFRFKCDDCDRAFTKKRALDIHKSSKHWKAGAPGPKYFFCEIEGCGFKTLYQYYMTKHLRWTHTGDQGLMCDTCGAMFKNEHYLKIHKRVRHTEAETFTCDICGLKIRTSASLKMHRNRVHGIGQPTKLCSYCTYITYTKSELDRHMFQKHDVPLPSGKPTLRCPHCDYKAITKSVMDEHILRHTADERQYPCTQCHKSFITEKDLKGHMAIHNPERKRHQCPHCDYSTPYGKYKLRLHVETMHERKDYKPWMCDICNYRTNIKGNLTLHLKNTHKLHVQNHKRKIHNLEPLASRGGPPERDTGPRPGKGKAGRQKVVVEQLGNEQNHRHQINNSEQLVTSHVPPAQSFVNIQDNMHLPFNVPPRGATITIAPIQQQQENASAVMGLENSVNLSSSQQPMELSLHNMATVSSHHHLMAVGEGGSGQGDAALAFGLQNARVLGAPGDIVTGAQTVYMDTIINSFVSRSDQPL